MGSGWFLHYRENRQRDGAMKAQIIALLRVVEQRMLGVRDHAGIPIEGWVSIDRLEASIFAIEAARALKATERYDTVYSTVIEIQQIRGAIEYVSRQKAQLRQRAQANEGRPGDWQEAQRLTEEHKAAGERAVQVLRDARIALGDTREVMPQIYPESAKDQISK